MREKPAPRWEYDEPSPGAAPPSSRIRPRWERFGLLDLIFLVVCQGIAYGLDFPRSRDSVSALQIAFVVLMGLNFWSLPTLLVQYLRGRDVGLAFGEVFWLLWIPLAPLPFLDGWLGMRVHGIGPFAGMALLIDLVLCAVTTIHAVGAFNRATPLGGSRRWTARVGLLAGAGPGFLLAYGIFIRPWLLG